MSIEILFVQGGGEDVHDCWDHRLVASLERELGTGFSVRYPRMPDEGDPHYARWRDALHAEFDALPDGAILAGHSIGGAMLLEAAAEYARDWLPGAIVLLAAPFIGEGGWPSDEMKPVPEFSARLSADVPILLFHGSSDETVPLAHTSLFEPALGHPEIVALVGRDHQLGDDLSEVAAAIRRISASRASRSAARS